MPDRTPANRLAIDSLLLEYEGYATEATQPDGAINTGKLSHVLVEQGDWTPKGADALLRLATAYGTFMLRNALALAAACGVEDGASGY